MTATLRLTFSQLTIDMERYRVLVSGKPLLLSYRDYALLVYLTMRSGQVVAKRQLLSDVLGRHDLGSLRMVDERMRRIRGLLDRAGCPCIGVLEDGYRFDPNQLSVGLKHSFR